MAVTRVREGGRNQRLGVRGPRRRKRELSAGWRVVSNCLYVVVLVGVGSSLHAQGVNASSPRARGGP